MAVTTRLRASGGPIVFLDKDGTLVPNVPYNVDPARLRLVPGAGAALAALDAAGLRIVVATNQSGVARGYFPLGALRDVETRLAELLADVGVPLAAFHACPHHPDGVNEFARRCACRKPAPGLLVRAAGELGADLHDCWVVGDILDDVEAGRRAGCRTVLVDRGGETEWRTGRLRRPDHVVGDLAAAAAVIVATGGQGLCR